MGRCRGRPPCLPSRYRATTAERGQPRGVAPTDEWRPVRIDGVKTGGRAFGRNQIKSRRDAEAQRSTGPPRSFPPSVPAPLRETYLLGFQWLTLHTLRTLREKTGFQRVVMRKRQGSHPQITQIGPARPSAGTKISSRQDAKTAKEEWRTEDREQRMASP